MTATIPTSGAPVPDGAQPAVTEPTPTAARSTEWTRRDKGMWVAGILAAIALAVTMASLAGTGNVKLAVVPVAAIGALGLAYLALTRFELFVLTCLFLRSSLDAIGGQGTTITNPSSLISLAFMAAALLWLAGRAHRGVRISSVLTLPLMFFAVACFLSVLTSQLKTVSAVEFSRILSVIVMAIVLERLAVDPPAVKRIMFAAMGSALIPLFASLGTWLIGAPLMDKRAALQDGIKRVRGTFDQANGFSRYLLFIIIMGVALYPHLPKRWRIPMLAGLGGLGVLMILTYTRSSWLALVIGLMVVGWLQSKKLLLVLIVMGLGVALFVPSVVNRFSDLTADNGPSTALTGEGNSLAWRFSYWNQVVNLAADNPVTGIGLRVTEEISGGNKQPHNDFVRAYVEMGAIGLMAYILLLTAMARVAVRGVRDARPGWQRGVAVGFAGCFISFVLVSVAANVMSQAVVLWYLFAFGACTAAVGKFGWIDKRNAQRAGGQSAPAGAISN